MEMVILVIHIILALGIIGVVLLQPPESSSLGGLGGSNAMAGPSGRGKGNLLTRATAILATLFIITSLILAILSTHHGKPVSILDDAESEPAMNQPAKADADKAPVDEAVKTDTGKPAKPAPSVPLSE